MANKMLIDASHPEETRVVALRGNRVEDFDFESASKKPLRGNIYLAKVTRVEPSLQAAFIEYGGNRHGFLAFSEIHPDYYQIPVADRQALLEEEARAHREEDDDHRPSGGGSHGGGGSGGSGGDRNGRRSRRHRSGRNGSQGEKRAEYRANPGDEIVSEAAELDHEVDQSRDGEMVPDPTMSAQPEGGYDPVPSEAESYEPTLPFPEASAESAVGDEAPEQPFEAAQADDEPASESAPAPHVLEQMDLAEAAEIEAEADARSDEDGDADTDELSESEDGLEDAGSHENGRAEDDEEPVEQLGGDAMEDATYRAPRLRRHYKIQEVIKRRQILLVQVVKEERGNKGAALTTYLSLAGRYSVLMPNTARGGGISRKITDADDRRRLKAIAQVLDVPEGMGIILRTAGAARGEVEVKRDFEYLLRMWETVRELTLSSSAPKLVYEEGSLIKRAIRDLYTKDFEEVWVSGEAGYREAKDYMRLLMPGHSKNVHLYADPQPIFAKSGAEAQLDAMFSNHVTLKSGGYLVINQTEALVAIDVNSGRSTREHNIEDTAVRTNLEAADEVARQLRLRDLAGLIVVDFIDMEEGRNNRAVERRIKDALKNDRARIQIGRISHFGLLEMSRQRIRTGVLEGSTVICPHCAGAGTVRSTSSIALHVLRVLEDTLIRGATHNLMVRTRTEVALYILNQKRANLMDLEQRFGVTLVVTADGTLTGTVYHAIERGELATPPVVLGGRQAVIEPEDDDVEIDDAEAEGDADEESAPLEAQGPEEQHRRAEGEEQGGRRRRRRRRRGRDRDTRESGELPRVENSEDGTEESEESDELGAVEDGGVPASFASDDVALDQSEPSAEVSEAPSEDAPVEPRRRPRRTRRTSARTTTGTDDELPEIETVAIADEEPVAAPRRSRRSRSRTAEQEVPSLLAFEPPSADRDVGADTVEHHPSDPEPTEPAVAAHESAEPLPGSPSTTTEADATTEPKPVVAVPANDEPPRPKRSGWWQRAKATLAGD